MSEKAYKISQLQNVYVFDVPLSANKQTIIQAVESQFGVKVIAARTANIKGKVKMSYRKGTRPIKGQRVSIKKAYITLDKKDSLPFFTSEEKDENSSKAKNKKEEKK